MARKFNSTDIFPDIDRFQGIEYPWTREEYPSETGDGRDRSSSYTDDHKAMPPLVRRTSSRRDGSGANFNPDLRLRITRGLVPCQRKKGDGDEVEHRETGKESWMGGGGGGTGMKGYFEGHEKFQLSWIKELKKILEHMERIYKMEFVSNCFTDTFYSRCNQVN